VGLSSYLAFLGVSLIVICTPGQDTALTIRNTLIGGRAGGDASAMGVAAGQAVWTAATSAGLAVVVMASAPLFLAIRLGGAAYLVYLGLNFCLLSLAWLVAYAFAVARLGGWLRRTRVRRALDLALGSVLIAPGLRVGREALVSS